MNSANPVASPRVPALTNGSGAAAILAASIGSFAVAVLALAADKLTPIKSILIFYKPTGALSGVTTAAILIWLLTWAILQSRWAKKTVSMGRTCFVAFALLGLSFLLTFPPIADLF
jgi:hypothetical protein